MDMSWCLLALGLVWVAGLVSGRDPSEKLESVVICEGGTQSLQCPDGKHIHVISATYGRSDKTTCPHNQVGNTNCKDNKSPQIAFDRCENKKECSLEASNGWYGDPCPNTYKYLTVDFQCIKDPSEKLESVVICEGGTQSLQCPDGKHIQVISATYGRSDKTTCPHNQVGNTNCKDNKSPQIAFDRCENKKKCSLEASNTWYGDPCPNTYKYLTVDFQCIKDPSEKFESVVICEGGTQSLQCPDGKHIHVISATYGRSDKTTCPHNQVGNTNCKDNKSPQIAFDRCENKKECSLEASNAWYGDPCPNTYKYLTVDFQCIKDPSEKLESVVICEGGTQSLQCPDGKHIQVISATYGRSDKTTCPHNQVGNTNCKDSKSSQIAFERCENKKECYLEANNAWYGDPCPNTYKYLTVDFQCIKDPSEKLESVVICEGGTQSLQCPDGKHIHVISATYGRSDKTTCPHNQVGNTNCKDNKSPQIAFDRCENKKKCSLEASNTWYGDPCPNTYKYLTVDFQCIKDPSEKFESVVICEGGTQSLQCPDGKHIHVISATYGRSDKTTCPHNQVGNTNCKDNKSPQIAFDRCENKKECSLEASNAWYGDPCPNTYKYLTVDFQCIKDPSEKLESVVICEGGTQSLQCPDGKHIQVISATYGRSDKTTCPHNQVGNTNCKDSKSSQIAFERCENKKECYLEANNAWYGDPCPNTYKYLTVDFQCIKDPSEKLESVVICEGGTQSLQCPDGKHIQVISATYGRSDKTTCPHIKVGNTNCKDNKSSQIAFDKCENKKECSLEASNGWYGDPCQNTYKYLTVDFQCIKDPSEKFESVVICEGGTQSLQCPDGKHIHVISATYGRSDKTTCPHIKVGNTNCKDNKSSQIAFDKCENKKECSLEASNGWYGDPCPNTYKYLTVDFQCIKDPSEKFESVVICEGGTQSLQCPDGKHIHVISATYGRSDKTTCPHIKVGNTNCKDNKSSQIAFDKCENKKECSLEASNGWYGDPCPNTYKYLTVDFQCIKDPSEKFESVVICEGGTQSLQCPDGKHIHVISATYGRSDKTTCPHIKVGNTNCKDNKSSQIAFDKCENKKECSLEASNGWYGDPCPNTYKYLTVDFQCIKDPSEKFESVVICEGGTQSLQCPDGKHIHVISATYGRSDKTTCPHIKVGNTNCKDNKSSQIAFDKCENKKECSLEASNAWYGDPCPNTYKYLTVDFECIKDPSEKLESVVICEGGTQDLQCPDGKHIQVISATYGRSDKTTCPHNQVGNTNCKDSKSSQIAFERCENKKECSLEASNAWYGDPCPNTYKYLTVDFECIKDPSEKLESVVICEGGTQDLQCPDGKHIQVISATYGRSDKTTCPHNQVGNTNCKDNKSSQIAFERCENKKECSLEASNAWYGDPCPNTYKYLTVDFQCIKDPSEKLESVVICEGGTQDLQCPDGKHIQVISATYGRSDKTTCPHNQVGNTNCKDSKSSQIAFERCENKKECSLEASNAWYGDPCPNTYKYLTVDFECIKDPSEKLESVVICEGGTQDLQCPDGKHIQVISATYGRSDKTTCPHNQVGNTNCKDSKSSQIAFERCENKKECSLEASNAWYGDPCPNTYKYLTVDFQCIKDGTEKVESVVICEGGTQSLRCPDRKHIQVISATYGRADKTTCPHNQVSNTNCKDNKSLHIFFERCENKKECSLEASNGWYGDPCPNTYKYLTVDFQCIKDPSEKLESVVICEGGTQSLQCPDGKHIQVISATYGRSDKTTCPHNQVGNTNCKDSKSLQIAFDRCENRTECTLEASNSWYGDPCPNTYKYLTVDFQCIKGNI